MTLRIPVKKAGEKQVVLKEEQDAKWKYFWMDADDLARCIAAVLRQNPFVSQQGTNDLFGKYFPTVFPAIHDPSHNRCKFSYWLVEMIEWSYDGKARWKGVNDALINQQKDFKRDATWTLSSLIAHQLKNHFCFEDNLENRFVAYCEKWRFSKVNQAIEEFEMITFEMIDDAFRLLHAISKPLLGKRLPKSKGSYSKYDDLFKGPNYEFIRQQICKDVKVNYQKKLRRSMAGLVEFLKHG